MSQPYDPYQQQPHQPPQQQGQPYLQEPYPAQQQGPMQPPPPQPQVVYVQASPPMPSVSRTRVSGSAHTVHLVLTILTCGLWAPIWGLHWLFTRNKTVRY